MTSLFAIRMFILIMDPANPDYPTWASESRTLTNPCEFTGIVKVGFRLHQRVKVLKPVR